MAANGKGRPLFLPSGMHQKAIIKMRSVVNAYRGMLGVSKGLRRQREGLGRIFASKLDASDTGYQNLFYPKYFCKDAVGTVTGKSRLYAFFVVLGPALFLT